MSDYQQIWSDLGLDLEAYDALLTVLSSAYQDVFLIRKDRPEQLIPAVDGVCVGLCARAEFNFDKS